MIWYVYILQNYHYHVSLTSITTHSYNFFVWWALLTPTFLETSKCTSIINYRHHAIHYYFITGSVYFFTTCTDFTRIFNGGNSILWSVIYQLIQCLYSFQFTSVQSLSHVQLCDPMNRTTPGLPVHHQLPEFTQTHVHRVGDAIQPSIPLSSPSPLAPNPSQHQSLFQWVNSSHEVAKVLEFQL